VYVAPQTETEKILCEIWQEVLGVERVGITDNFFQLGGHSLSAIIMASKIEAIGNFKLELKDIFELGSLQKISEFLDSKGFLSSSAEKNLETEIEW